MDKHIKRQKKTALIMCILFIVVTFACLFYIEKELNHECNGEDCPVCACIYKNFYSFTKMVNL